MRNITAIFRKQITDTLKNKTVLIMFVMFPALVVIMEKAVKIDNMPEHFFVKLFSVMFIGMAPLVSMASIISEEKEKNTLRVLLMSSIRPAEYLTGTGAYVFIMCAAGTGVFAAVGGYRGTELLKFLLIMFAGIILSEVTGAVIGVFSRDQMNATSIYVPVMMVFSFLPMISTFNDTVRNISRVTYSQQISELISGIGSSGISGVSVAVIAINLMAAVILFTLAYKRKGLE